MNSIPRLRRMHVAIAIGVITTFGATLWPSANMQPLQPGISPHAVYYVATTGNDQNAGSPNAPFRTIGRCVLIVQPGQTCEVAGGVYHETVTPQLSGTPGNPITFTAAAGENVIIDGADPLTGTWTQEGGSAIYDLAVTLPNSANSPVPHPLWGNQIFFGAPGGAAMLTLARWPQQASQDPLFGLVRATAEGGSGTNLIVDSHLPAIDWTGATVHTWGQGGWTAQTAQITSSVSGQVGFAASDPECPNLCTVSGARYYLDGIKAALRYPGQWSYNAGAHTLSVWLPDGTSPQGKTLEAKARMWGFNLNGYSYITVKDIALWGTSVTTDVHSSFDTLDAITATYLSDYADLPTVPWLQRGVTPVSTARFAHALDSGIVLSGTHNILENAQVSESAGNGVLVSGAYITVTNTLIHDTDYMGTYAAPIKIYHPALPLTPAPDWITHNTVYNTARDGIQDDYYWQGQSGPTVIAYNDVWNYGVLNGDLGAIRDCCNMVGTGESIDHNWMHDIAASTCVACTAGAGLYLDNGPISWVIADNVAWNDANAAYFANTTAGVTQGNHITLENNTAPTSANGAKGFWLGGDPNPTFIALTNNILAGGADSSAGAGYTNQTNLLANPAYVDSPNNDYRLASGSAAIDAGTLVPGITDGFVGTAPDQGAYEFGGTDWVPGCDFNLTLCQDPHVPARHAP